MGEGGELTKEGRKEGRKERGEREGCQVRAQRWRGIMMGLWNEYINSK